jgi:WxcM-like, C-terminal
VTAGAARLGASVGVDDCRILDLPVIHSDSGNLTFVEGGRQVPFDIARVFYLYDVPGGGRRGAHAHRTLEQVLVAMSGSFDVVVFDGSQRRTVSLNRSYRGLYLPPMIWREMENFSSGSVCMVLASDYYDEGNYIRDYDEFLQAARAT